MSLLDLFRKTPLIRWSNEEVEEAISKCFIDPSDAYYDYYISWPPSNDRALLKWFHENEEVDGTLYWVFIFLQVPFNRLPFCLHSDLESVRKVVAYRLEKGK